MRLKHLRDRYRFLINMMTYNKAYNYFKDLKNVDPPITSKLITKGYRQKSGGYIATAQKSNIDNPTQWWHIIHYCREKIEKGNGDKTYRYTPCGELLIYMAEMSNAVEKSKLKELVDAIVNSSEMSNRRKWNNEIKKLCWNSIKKTIGK